MAQTIPSSSFQKIPNPNFPLSILPLFTMTGMIHKNNGLPGETLANRGVRRHRNVFQIERLPSKLIDRPSPFGRLRNVVQVRC